MIKFNTEDIVYHKATLKRGALSKKLANFWSVAWEDGGKDRVMDRRGI
jgi:hypothetical protein